MTRGSGRCGERTSGEGDQRTDTPESALKGCVAQPIQHDYAGSLGREGWCACPGREAVCSLLPAACSGPAEMISRSLASSDASVNGLPIRYTPVSRTP